MRALLLYCIVLVTLPFHFTYYYYMLLVTIYYVTIYYATITITITFFYLLFRIEVLLREWMGIKHSIVLVTRGK